MSTHETSRDYQNPRRPALIRGYNASGLALARVGLARPLDADSLVAQARRQAGVDARLDPALDEPLRRMVDALEREAALTPIGRMMTRQRILGSLVQRLRASALFEQRPEILAAPLARPVFVTGLQRSGTTVMQRLLGQLPGARPLPAWEAFEPAPDPRFPPGSGPLEADPRFARARRAERWIHWISPDLFAVHPMDAAAPEEEVVLMDHSLLTTVAEFTYRVPSYARWVEQQDQTPAYRWLADALKLLAWQRPGDRSPAGGRPEDFWVLKTPHHLEWLDVLFEVFPDAVVVQTHRDPSTTIASFCSMVAHMRGLMSDRVDPLDIGQQLFAKIGRMIDRSMSSRDARGGQGFVDVHYHELVEDPVGVLERVCAAIDLPKPPQRSVIEQWLAGNQQHKHGVHRYAAADFGLDQDALQSRFAAYRERFGVASEKA